MRRYCSIEYLPLFLAAASLAALAGAYTAEYGFGLKPCELCLWQRVPYALIAVLFTLSCFFRTSAVQSGLRWVMAALMVLEAGLAAYHVGVEQHFFAGLEGCSGGNAGAQTLDALRAAILDAPLVMCSQPSFYFLGLTMAAWNAVYASILAGLSLFLLLRHHHGKIVP